MEIQEYYVQICLFYLFSDQKLGISAIFFAIFVTEISSVQIYFTSAEQRFPNTFLDNGSLNGVIYGGPKAQSMQPLNSHF